MIRISIHVFITCITIAALAFLLVPGNTDEAAAITEEEYHHTWLYLYDNHFMHTEDDDANRDGENVNGNDEVVWDLGFETGHTFDDALHNDLFIIKHTASDEYELNLYVENQNIAQSTDVRMELREDQTVIAELDWTLGNSEVKDLWNLKIRPEHLEEKDGEDGHTFLETKPLRIRLVNLDANNIVNVQYEWSNGNEKARLRAYTNQMYMIQEELKTFDWKGDEISSDDPGGAEDRYFMPNMPSGKALIELRGQIRDAYGNYDISEVAVRVYEDGNTDPIGTGFADTIDREDGNNENYYKEFSFEWNYTETPGLDPGDYYFEMVVRDQSLRPDDEHVIYTKSFEMGQYGSYLEDDEGQDEPHRYIGKGDSAEFYIRVYNVGTTTGDIHITNDELGDGWNAVVDPDVVSPSPGDYEIVTLTVSAPENAGEETRLVTVTATAGSGGSEYDYYFDTRTTTTPLYGVELFFDLGGGDQGKGMDAEQEKNTEEKYDFVILNTGTDSDTFDFVNYGIEPDWSVEIQNAAGNKVDQITLTKDEDMTLFLVVTPASSGGDDTARMYVRATSQSSDDFRDTVWFNITRTYGVSLTPVYATGETYFEAEAGRRESHSLWLENLKDDDNYTFILSVIDNTIPDGWYIEFQDDRMLLDPGDSTSVRLYVTPKAGEPYREEARDFDVRVEAEEDSSIFIEREVRVKVKKTFSLEINADRDSRTVKPDKDVTFVISVLNSGNVDASFIIRIDNEPKDWSIRLSPSSWLLSPGEQNDFKVTITSPDDADDDDKEDFNIVVYADTEEGEVSDETTVTVKVEKSKESTISDIVAEPTFLMLIGVVVLIVVIGINQMRARAAYEDYGEEDYEDDAGDENDNDEEGEYEDEYEYED